MGSVLAACGDDGGEASSHACASVKLSVSEEGAVARVPPAPEQLATAVAEPFCSEFTYSSAEGPTTTWPAVVTSEDASCIADELIERFGETTLREWFVGYPWSLLGFALMNEVDRGQAEQLADTFASCSDRWKLLLIKSVTEGAEQISDASAGCVSEQLSDDDAREVMVLELDRAYDDPSQPNAVPYPETVEPLLTAMEECLSPTELDALDWN